MPIWEKKKMTVHCSRKRGFHKMNKKNEDIRIFFLIKESQSESGTYQTAHGIICSIIPHRKKGKTILIVHSNKNMKWAI